ncbi:DNA repair protein RecF [Sphingobium quisquiliarum P25]|uniref:DNA replication and repair protein RecF n=1 Tax=Sphingobium quisquiliarum P25 TaxID=1329909 RepID=T0HNR3_9SPHN|nr:MULTISPECIES: DNA replication/repair protein RecF [Sphingobium]EQB13788.1 DNA repair protein RecF [Sphingobium quisquiliarum P25]EZP71585.1 DNA replication and repair protein RecF [Sphingomonas paucimobilis]
MIGRLTLSDFRNHADALIVPDHAFIVLTGENGAGKTNILEAVSMLAPGRGLRGAALRDMARQDGAGGFGIAAEVDGVMLGTGVAAGAPDRRQVRIGGVASSANALADHLAIAWLTPAMDRLFMDSPGGRRRFLDRLTLALHPGHAVHSARYEAAMRARNRLLTDPRAADPAWLAALEAQMGEHGAVLASARADMVARLNAELAVQPGQPFARPLLDMMREEGADEPLAPRLARERRRDAAAGRTLSGPHRHDLAVTHAAKGQAAALCSTGEQKALLLSILLAHAALVAAQRGQPPVLLLDEVAAHLDPMRRAALFDRLRATGGQVWMTGTEASLFSDLASSTRLTVSAGHVHGSAD